MAKTKKGSFVKCAGSEEFLEIGIDKIYTNRLTTTVEGAKGTRYIHCEVALNHEYAMKILQMFVPKRIHWEEWIPPTEEEKKQYGDKARGKNIPYDGVVA
jgi:hypothetical protein